MATGSQITSSSLPNPVWAPEKAADDSLGPTNGWLGEWSPGTAENPWINFKFPNRALISHIEVVAASFPQTGKNRFPRPKKIHIDFADGAAEQRLDFELKDNETDFQNLKFAPMPADAVTLTIDDVYADARITGVTGFQEIKIYGMTLPAAEPDTISEPKSNYTPPALSPISPQILRPQGALPPSIANKKPPSATITEPDADADSGGTDDAGGTPALPKGTLSADEREILDLLKVLIQKLEKKFLED